MPGFDGTGPLGQGPLTGGGRGSCVVPLGYNPGVPYGFSGTQKNPVNTSSLYPQRYSMPYIRSYPPGSSRYPARSAGYFRGRGGGRSFLGGTGVRGRGRRF